MNRKSFYINLRVIFNGIILPALLAVFFTFPIFGQNKTPDLNVDHCFVPDYDCFIIGFSKYIADHPDLSDTYTAIAYLGRGVSYYEKGAYKDALSDLNKTIDPYIGINIGYLYRGKIYYKTGKYAEALSDFNNAIDHAEALSGRGNIYFIQRKYDLAMKDFERAIELNHRLAEAYLGRGKVYLERGENSLKDENYVESEKAFKNAIKNFDTVIELALNNADIETYAKRAVAYDKLGEKEKAEADRKTYKELTEKP